MEAPVPAQSWLWDQLTRRRVIRSLVAYGAGAFALLEGAQPVFTGLLLPDLAFRILVVLVLAGFPAVAVLAWLFDLTEDGIRRTPSDAEASPGGAASGTRRLPLRGWLQVGGAFLLVGILAAATAAEVGRARFPSSGSDGRVGLAVFPFRTSAGTDPVWANGAPDLLITALDGTAGLRLVDPWTLWKPLRPAADAPATPPESDEAPDLARAAGAHRYVLGSVVSVGGAVELTLRVYQVGRSEPISTFAVRGAADSVLAVVRRTAVGVLAHLWGRRRPPDVPAELNFDATRSPDALKAYLAAKAALRQGRVDSASRAIDRAIALDSSFVLALVEAVTIKSWGFYARGQPYQGFFELLARAKPFADSVNPRTRLRLEAMDAAVRTEGARGWDATGRILAMDSTDFLARVQRVYIAEAYGWQFGLPDGEAREIAERTVRLDSTNVPMLTARAWLAVALEDTLDQRDQLRRLLAADTTGDLAAGWIAALRASLSGEKTFTASVPRLAALPIPRVLAVLRALRVSRPGRAATLFRAMADVSGDPSRSVLAGAELARLEIAEGRIGPVDSAIAAGGYRRNDVYRLLDRLIVAAALHGVGASGPTHRAVSELQAWLPPESALARLRTQPVSEIGWLIGAWNAAAGDTVIARRWIRTMRTLPPGGSPEHYAEALEADIESRLAERRGQATLAMREARRAFRLWSIHTENAVEFLPEPSMRFHLAQLYRTTGQPDSARALFGSLVPPTTWVGFLTARAALELGRLAEERGDRELARRHYERALGLWRHAGPVGSPWREAVDRGLASLGPATAAPAR